MSQTRHVFLYGSSLFIAGLEASLSSVPSITIRRPEMGESDLLACLQAAMPDFVVFELGAISDEVALSLLRGLPGVDLIGLDLETDRLLVMSVRQQTAPDTADLVRIIQDKGSSGK